MPVIIVAIAVAFILRIPHFNKRSPEALTTYGDEEERKK
jgi:hypothetical protein